MTDTTPRPTTDIPSSAEVQALGLALERDGLTTHQAELERIARLAVRTGTAVDAAEVLRDLCANETVRLRAFATIAQSWNLIRPAAKRWRDFDRSFDRLAAQAESHRKLKRSGGAVDALWDSRVALDAMRADVGIRRATLA